MNVNDVVKYLNDKFPEENASLFDQGKIGLSIGSNNNKVTKILFSLDLTKEVAEEAVKEKAELIITHHPYFFNPLTKIDYDSPIGKTLIILLQNNISVFSMHTNFDVGENGVNDTLGQMLGLKDMKVIREENSKNNFLRYGFINEMTLEKLCNNVKKIFNQDVVRVIGDLSKKVKKVGLVGGSGAHDDDLNDALSVQLDAYITGEVKLPQAIRAYSENLAIIEVNHGVEKYALYPLAKQIYADLKIECKVSEINTDPFKGI